MIAGPNGLGCIVGCVTLEAWKAEIRWLIWSLCLCCFCPSITPSLSVCLCSLSLPLSVFLLRWAMPSLFLAFSFISSSSCLVASVWCLHQGRNCGGGCIVKYRFDYGESDSLVISHNLFHLLETATEVMFVVRCFESWSSVASSATFCVLLRLQITPRAFFHFGSHGQKLNKANCLIIYADGQEWTADLARETGESRLTSQRE